MSMAQTVPPAEASVETAVGVMSILELLVGSLLGAVLMFVPVHFAVKLLKGTSELKKSFLVVLMVNLINGFIALLISLTLQLPLLSKTIGFLIAIIAYKISFELSWIRAILVGIIAAILFILIMMGVGLVFGGLVAVVI